MMFQARKPEASNRTVRMPNQLIDELGLLAQAQNISFNMVVVQCCEYALSELSPEQREAVEAIRKESESKDTKAVLI